VFEQQGQRTGRAFDLKSFAAFLLRCTLQGLGLWKGVQFSSFSSCPPLSTKPGTPTTRELGAKWVAFLSLIQLLSPSAPQPLSPSALQSLNTLVPPTPNLMAVLKVEKVSDLTQVKKEECRYTACYCEENVFLLCKLLLNSMVQGVCIRVHGLEFGVSQFRGWRVQGWGF